MSAPHRRASEKLRLKELSYEKLRVKELSYEKLRVNEIFYSIQGESSFAGRPCVLVRLTGCQMRCSWCDSEYSFYEGEWMSRGEVLERIADFHCPEALAGWILRDRLRVRLQLQVHKFVWGAEARGV